MKTILKPLEPTSPTASFLPHCYCMVQWPNNSISINVALRKKPHLLGLNSRISSRQTSKTTKPLQTISVISLGVILSTKRSLSWIGRLISSTCSQSYWNMTQLRPWENFQCSGTSDKDSKPLSRSN